MRAMKRLRPQSQHVHQTRLVKHRIGIRRTHHAGHPACRCSSDFARQRSAFDVHGKVDEPRRDDKSFGVDLAVAVPICRCRADTDYFSGGDEQVRYLIKGGGGIDDASPADGNLYRVAPARIAITAIRTAMPYVTCGRITD